MTIDAHRVALIAIGSVSVAAFVAWYFGVARRKRQAISARRKSERIEEEPELELEEIPNDVETESDVEQEQPLQVVKNKSVEERQPPDQEEEEEEDEKVEDSEEDEAEVEQEVVGQKPAAKQAEHVQNVFEKPKSANPSRHSSVLEAEEEDETLTIEIPDNETPENLENDPSGDLEEHIESQKIRHQSTAPSEAGHQEASPANPIPLMAYDIGSWSAEMNAEEPMESDSSVFYEDRNKNGTESSDLQSENSEASSNDSGCATGGKASSPALPNDDTMIPQYEFEIPNSLVGLVIGVKGKTIKELSQRTNVKILIRPHHAQSKADSFQICQVRGRRELINKCLCMLRRRFPPHRFPDLNLQPVMPPPLPQGMMDLPQISFKRSNERNLVQLNLPEGVMTEVVVSYMKDPSNFSLHQPTHPSYASLTNLDRRMLQLYKVEDVPELPMPCNSGTLCVAPVLNAFFRAVVIVYYPDTDEVLVRFADYGGHAKLPRRTLKQIRTDLIGLPLQATQCYLANVQPADGTWQWGEKATELFKEMTSGKVIEAQVVGYHIDDRVPCVELTVTYNEKVVRVDQVLMELGLAKASDPSKMSRLIYRKPTYSTH